jgi:photosystem II stability/assembly factor-like uncharacterized protein/PKD repeat protein
MKNPATIPSRPSAAALSLILLCLSLAAFGQKTLRFTSPPDAAAPPWAQLMYAERPNVQAVDSAYRAWHEAHGFVKTTHTQYYKKWRRSVERRLQADGYVAAPDWDAQFAREKRWAEQLRREPTARSAELWTHLGPKETFSTMPGQQEVSWQANVYCIDQSLTAPEVLFCGTEAGGIYKTTDRGLNWQHSSANTLMRAVHSIRIHPSDPQIVYAGDAARIYKTTDGGQNWAAVFTRPNLVAHAIAINPADPDIVLVAGEGGLFRSVNGGADWAQLYSETCWDLAIHPTQPQIVYVLKTNPAARRCEFFKSEDFGATFSLRDNGWYSSSHSARRDDGARMTVTPAAPELVYVVLIGDSKPGDNGFIGVFRSADAGESWTLPNPPVGGPYTNAHPNLMTLNNTNPLYQGFYNLCIGASHQNPNQVLIGGLNLWKTDDGAQSYTPLGGYQGNLPWIHPDQQGISIRGAEAWVANDGGVNYSTDFFQTHQSRKNGIIASDFWGFGSGWNEDLLVGGRYHNGNTALRNTFPPGQALRLGGAEAPTGYVNPGIAGKAYFSDIDTRLIPQSIEEQVLIFPSLSQYPNESYFAAHSSELEFDPLCYRHLYIGKENQLWRSANEGASFELVRAFGNDSNRPVLHFELSRSQPGLMYVYQRTSFFGATLWKTADGGANWQALAFPAANSQRAGTMALSPEDGNTLWVAFGHQPNDGAKVFKTTDGGLSWENWTTPALDGHTAIYVFHQGGTNGAVYLGTDFGVFYRDDSMSDWELYNSGLPDAAYCNIIRPFYKEGKLRLATYSHGIWEADFKTPSRPLAQPMADKLSSRCARDTFYFEDYSLLRHEGASWQWDFPGASYVSDASARNPKVVFGSLGTYDVALTITDATGQSSSKAVPAMVSITADECAPDTVPGFALRLVGGSSDFASLPPLTMTTNTLTLSAWIKRDGPQPANAGIIFHRGDNGVGVGLNFGDANELRYHWDGQWWWNSGLVVPDQEWAHVALVITPQEARLYLNGQPAANSLGHPARVLHNAWYLGADPNFEARRFRGLMEEVGIWDRALSQEEIRELRHLTKRPQDDESLLAYYQFNEAEGDALDRAGLRHALLGGAATRLTSTCPVGGGHSVRATLSQAGLYVFDEVDLELELPAQGPYAGGEVAVSRLNLPPDQLANAEEHSRAYWVINNYGSNASFAPLADLAFANIGPVSTAQAASPGSLQLYGREENGEGDTWVLLAQATAATAGADGAARFAQGGEIAAFGQFVITRGEAPTSVRMEERLPYPYAVYPNPIASGGVLHIATAAEQPYDFILFNLQGGRLLQQAGLQGAASIALPVLPSGIYTYCIRRPDRWFYGQLVVGEAR